EEQIAGCRAVDRARDVRFVVAVAALHRLYDPAETILEAPLLAGQHEVVHPDRAHAIPPEGGPPHRRASEHSRGLRGSETIRNLAAMRRDAHRGAGQRAPREPRGETARRGPRRTTPPPAPAPPA